jgi:hypothetical protein
MKTLSTLATATATAACAVVMLVGCGDGTGAAAGADARSTPAAEVGAADAGYDDIPTVEELESQLATEVTDANADAEFEKLQQELAAEQDG